MFGQPSFKVFGVSLFSVLGEDGLDLLGNEAAVVFAVDGHDRSKTAGDNVVR